MNTPAMPWAYPDLCKQQGLSLIELMISLVIGLILLLGITTLIVEQSSARNELEKSSRQIENGRYAMQILHDDIQHAGFYGQYYALATATGTPPDPCSISSAGLNAGILLPVQGYDSSPALPITTSPISCLNTANIQPGTDILVIRRAATALVNPGINISAPQIRLQTNSAGYKLEPAASTFSTSAGTYPAPFTLLNTKVATPAPLREYLVNIYFISPCSVMANGSTCTATDDNGKPIPTLKRLNITADNPTSPLTPEPLVEGIINMQLDYGLDNNADGYPDNNYTSVPVTAADWQNVMSIRVNLLAENIEPTPTYVDNKSYNMGSQGIVGPFNASPYDLSPACGGNAPYPQICNFKHHAFTGLVRVINSSARRAQQ